jgi:quercetin dioxygenase-like cupin family protein
MALHHAEPSEVVDLLREGASGDTAGTTAIVKTEAFEAIRLVLAAGADMAQHSVKGPMTLHCLKGQMALDLEDGSRELRAGEWLYLDGGTSHAVRGLEDSVALLTILFTA